MNLSSHIIVDLKVTMKSTTRLIKFDFGNSLMQRHCYYPYNINFMHQEHNVAESILSMCFDVTGFSKDSVNERKDIATLGNRPLLEPKRNAKGNLKRAWAPYCLKLTKRK
jgi:hypothetical protein